MTAAARPQWPAGVMVTKPQRSGRRRKALAVPVASDLTNAEEAPRLRALWSAVLNVALADAVARPIAMGGNSRNGVRQYLQDQARAFFVNGSADFHMVCEFAEVDAEAVQAKVLSMIEGRP